MPSIYALKPRFQALLRPLCRALAGRGVTANQVTLAACGLSLAHGAWLALAPGSALAFLLLPATLFARMALNAIDGMLAREFGQRSRLGALLNELCDIVSDAALYLPFALVAGLSAPLVVIAVFAALLTEAAGLAALAIGSERRYDGPMGKSDRAAAFGLLAVLHGAGLPLAPWGDIYVAAIALLSAWTVANRMRAGLRSDSGAPRP